MLRCKQVLIFAAPVPARIQPSKEKHKEYGGKALSAPCKLSFKFCKKVDCTSMMKSREYDETKKAAVY